jgi:hypothetical protein
MSTRQTLTKVFESLLEVESMSGSSDACTEMFKKEFEAITVSYLHRVDMALNVLRIHRHLNQAVLAPEPEVQTEPEAEVQTVLATPEPEVRHVQPEELQQWLQSQLPEWLQPEPELGQELGVDAEPEVGQEKELGEEPEKKRRPRSLYLNHHYWPSPVPKVFVQRLQGYPHSMVKGRITHDEALHFLARRMNCDLEDFLAMKPIRVYERLYGGYPQGRYYGWESMCKR